VRESVLRRHWISADSRPYLRSFLRCCIRLAIVWRRLPFVGRRQQHLFVNGAATIMIIVAIDDTLRRAPSCSPRYADSIFLGAGTERPSAQGAISGPMCFGVHCWNERTADIADREPCGQCSRPAVATRAVSGGVSAAQRGSPIEPKSARKGPFWTDLIYDTEAGRDPRGRWLGITPRASRSTTYRRTKETAAGAPIMIICDDEPERCDATSWINDGTIGSSAPRARSTEGS
jgi:hypothetical protein